MIEAAGLTKEYRRLRGGRTVALDRLDLSVPRGGVFGFLGPNGAGKTTTIRCLLGLVRAGAGSCSILGADPRRGLDKVIGKIGSIVEAPALFPTFSGRKNLEFLASLGDVPWARVQAVLEEVGLADRAKDVVKNYSLGMKQRLGIAAALLKDPELLILDEPANGLDPAGIREVRELLKSIGRSGRTVFVSSHLLSEVQQTCDRVAILARGRCVAAGEVSEVLSRARGTGVIVKIDDMNAAQRVLEAAGFLVTATEEHLRVEIDPSDGAEVARALAGAELFPRELRGETVDLETVFLQLTGEAQAR